MNEYGERLAMPQIEPPGHAPHAAHAPATTGSGSGEGDLLGLLEERIQLLIARVREGRRIQTRLQRDVEERDARIAELTARVDALEKLRGAASERVERLIERVARLETEA